MLLYYITDRSQFSGDEASRRKILLEKIAEAAAAGVDFIQLRERDLSGRELESLAAEAMKSIRENNPTPTRLLVNSRTDVAIAVTAAGVHLRSTDISPKDVREIWNRAVAPAAGEIVSVASHTLGEVALAAQNAADYALFGPVFEKKNDQGVARSSSIGLAMLKQSCKQKIPVIALGGVTIENADSCAEAGASGVAAIRMFQENQIANLVRRLRR